MRRKLYKPIITVLCLSIIMCTAQLHASSEQVLFLDLPSNHWAYGDIMTLVDKEIITGTSVPINGIGYYEPEGQVTLGQFLALATRLVAKDKIVDGNYAHWAEKNYNAAVSKNLIKDSDFQKTAVSLDASITREDMAYILVNIVKANGENLTKKANIANNLKDFNSISNDRKEAVLLCYSNGLITGKENGKFKPHDFLTRAEIATVFCRVMNFSKRPEATFEENAKKTPSHFEEYIHGDYKYTYSNQLGGWSVFAIDKTKSTYGDILSEIKGFPVVSMYKTFENCINLTYPPAIPESVKNLYATFQGCTSLTDLSDYTIPYGVEDLHCAFKGCESLKYAPKIPDSVINMYGAFMTCRALVEAPELSQNTENLSHAFAECDSLVIPPAITPKVKNMSYTFWYSRNISFAPELPDGLLDMSYAFSYTAITQAPIIPNTVENMRNAFASCSKLNPLPKEFRFPEKVVNIKCVFSYCYKITTVPEIPESVKDMRQAFSYCTSLQGEIKINANPEEYTDCFDRTIKQITLTGESTILEEISKTAKSGNVRIKQQ